LFSWVFGSIMATWVSQQLREAFPFDEAPRYLIHDRDGCYGADVHRTMETSASRKS
jgi:hypothetical protein